MKHFVGATARRDYWQFNLATFLCFSSMTQLTLLSVILDEKGVSEDKIGVVLSSFALSIIVATVVSGWLISYLGALSVAVIGLLVTFVGFVSMHWSVTAPVTVAALSRALQGAGFGIFLPAGTLYVKTRIIEQHQAYYVGLFASMVAVPTIFAPALAEWYLRAYGVGTFFIVMSLPIIASILLSVDCLKREAPVARVPNTSGYLGLLRDGRIFSKLMVVLTQGMFWGFVTAFLAMLLKKSNVAVAAFFTPLAITMFISRFWLMRYVEGFQPAIVSAAAVSSMLAAHVVFLGFVNTWSAAVAGVLFGWGYSVVYPTAVVWVSSQCPVDQRAAPIALISTVFHVGYFVTPLVGGYVIADLGFSALILLLCSVALLTIAILRSGRS